MSSSRSASASGKAGREGLGLWRPDVAGHARKDHECGADCTGPFLKALILKCITFILRRPTSKSAEGWRQHRAVHYAAHARANARTCSPGEDPFTDVTSSRVCQRPMSTGFQKFDYFLGETPK